ncbi:MAG TPA: hypothetical protein DCR93_07190 [Cytophagales bacterium]|nr:hypothetical protein [Cytophagales bacterium]
MSPDPHEEEISLKFHGGYLGVLLPFFFFLMGAVIIALSGAPDERGLWPVLIGAMGLGLVLAKDRNAYSEVLLQGMSQKIVMIMITAWMLASCIGVLMTKTGLVEALIWLSLQLNLGPAGFLLATFLICCVISMSTGSSFATILICSPLLYPSGGMMGVELPLLAGAILSGATFGDFSAPISDTTIASALSQQANIGRAVRSRLKYSVPVLLVSGIVFVLLQMGSSSASVANPELLSGEARGLPMLGVPVLIIFLFLRGKHLVVGLMAGLFAGILIGLAFGLLPWGEVIALDLDNFRATSFIIDGITRAVGISFFTILLMGLVQTIKASGILASLVAYASARVKSSRAAKGWITGVTSLAVLLTTHSIVAILMVGEFVSQTGSKSHISEVQRANLMSLAVCFFPFVLPYFIPVILMANMTQTGTEYGLAQQSPLAIGMYNIVAWGLLIYMLFILFRREQTKTTLEKP